MPNRRIAIYDIPAAKVSTILHKFDNITLGKWYHDTTKSVSTQELLGLFENITNHMVFDIRNGFALLKFMNSKEHFLLLDEGSVLYNDLMTLAHED